MSPARFAILGTLLLAACGEATPHAASEPPTAASPVAATATPVIASAVPAPSAAATSPSQEASRPGPDDTPPLPEGFVSVEGEFDSTEGGTNAVACGSLRVSNVLGDPKVFEPYVVVTDASGAKVYEAHGRRYDMGGVTARMQLTASVCGDLTGDGIPELLLTERTIGAHCCYTYYVTSLSRPSKVLLMWEKGDSGNGFWPVKLKAGKTFQIQSVDLVLPPFKVDEGDPPLPYAAVPGFPIVFDLVNGKYEKRTFAFAQALRTQRDARDAVCAKRVAAGETEPAGCEAYDLQDWGLALIVGDWAAKKEQIVPDAELRALLDLRAPAMRKRLRSQLGG